MGIKKRATATPELWLRLARIAVGEVRFLRRYNFVSTRKILWVNRPKPGDLQAPPGPTKPGLRITSA
jgi:hypothetical protein